MSEDEEAPILFITRTYPPQIGGMETLSWNIINEIGKKKPIRTIINRHGKKALPVFLPYAFCKAVYHIIRHEIRIIHLSDAVLAPLGLLLKKIFPSIFVVTNVHGLDLTYAEKSQIYKKINIQSLKKLDRIIAVSTSTKEIAMRYGVKSEKITIIHNGVQIPEKQPTQAEKDVYRKKIIAEYFNSQQKKQDKLHILLYIGRLTERKGVSWFLQEVMTILPDSFVLVIAGDGAERDKIQTAIKKNNLKERVATTGVIPEKTKEELLFGADILIMPNVEIAGDQEGFGITAIEAGAHGLPPIVANIEGLRDAITHEKNGLLVESKNAERWKTAILNMSENSAYKAQLGTAAINHNAQNFQWEKIGEKYCQFFTKQP